MDQRITRLAARQHGVVTRSQLLETGLTARKVDRRVAAGIFLSLHRGVYLLGSLRGSLEPERAREMAAILACGDRAAVSHASAAWLWNLVRRPGARSPVHITLLDRVSRCHPGIIIHRPRDVARADITRVDGIAVTTAGRTLRDLSTVLTVKQLNRAAARAEREGLIDAADLPDLVARHAGRPGAPVLRVALLGDGGPILTRSEAEERLLALVLKYRLPRPRVNAVVEGFEVDFHWPDERLVIEVDGFEHHRFRPSFDGDRQRDLVLEAKAITVLRVTWRHLVDDPEGTAGSILRAFGHAESRAALGRPPDHTR